MKKILTRIAILIVGLLIYLLFNNLKPNKPKRVNIQENPIIEKKISKETIFQKIQTNKEANKKVFNWLEGYDKQTDHTPNVGLIQAFREFRKVKRCRVVIEAIFKNEDPYQAYLSRINHRKKDQNLTVPTTLQHEFFDKWSDSCLDLLEFDGEQYTAAHERFRKRFYQTKPKTKIEKDFAESWPLAEETRFINFKYDHLINGYDIHNKKSTLAINKQIKHARGMLGYININDEIEYSNRSLDEINMYQRQLAELHGIMDGSIIIDEDYLVDVYRQYESNNKLIDEFLKQNISSEAFLTLAPLLFSNQNMKLGFYDKKYYQSIVPKVATLFACSMDYPCGTESKEIVRACFNSIKLSDVTACGKTIQNYYLSHYFSPNQLLDVDQLLNYFLQNYAKY